MERVLVVGDLQAQGLAGGLQRQLRGDASWRVIDRSRIATGLCSPTRFNWPAAAPASPRRNAARSPLRCSAPTIVLRCVCTAVSTRARAAFATLYRAHVRDIAEGLKRSCASVIWVGHPIVRDPVYAEDMAMLNWLYAAQSMGAGADWFPSWPLFIDADGNYVPYGKGIDGETTRLRADDGVHLTGAGYDVLASALLPVIALYRPSGTHV